MILDPTDRLSDLIPNKIQRQSSDTLCRFPRCINQRKFFFWQFIPTDIYLFSPHSLNGEIYFYLLCIQCWNLIRQMIWMIMISGKVQATDFFFKHVQTCRRSQISNTTWVKVLQLLLLRVHNCHWLNLELESFNALVWTLNHGQPVGTVWISVFGHVICCKYQVIVGQIIMK